MLAKTLTTLIFPALLLASPLAAPSDVPLVPPVEACTPESYTISGFNFTSGPNQAQHVRWNFASTFSDGSIIVDPAMTNGAVCENQSESSDSFPNETVCSTGRDNLLFDLTAPVGQSAYQIIHSWKCNGVEYISSTPYTIHPQFCNVFPGGIETCTSQTQTFQPQNVRPICGAPTCP